MVPKYQTIWYHNLEDHIIMVVVAVYFSTVLRSFYQVTLSSHLFIIYCHHETFQFLQFYYHSRLVNPMTESQNLFCGKDGTRVQRLLCQGKTAIVACLSKLPKTRHDPHSFGVDVTLFTVSLGCYLLD
jgi:hypothetical protein